MLEVPSRATEPIIETSIINFHDRRNAVPDCLIPHFMLDQHFGIFKLKIRNEIPNNTAIEDVAIQADYCEIYNYKTNTWVKILYIGHLYSNQEIVYQIRSLTPKNALIAIYGRTIHQTKMNNKITNDIVFQSHAIPVPIIISESDQISCDLTNYLFKQRSQELIFAIKHKQHVSQELDEYIHTLREYMRAHNLTESTFYKNIYNNIRSATIKETTVFSKWV